MLIVCFENLKVRGYHNYVVRLRCGSLGEARDQQKSLVRAVQQLTRAGLRERSGGGFWQFGQLLHGR